MKATIVDLRYRMRDVLKALDRNEEVEILYHGKTRGVIHPVGKAVTSEIRTDMPKRPKVVSHPFFGMNPDVEVEHTMDQLRGGRHRAV